MVFVIHWHESAMDLHVFPIPIPSPTSLSTRSLWVFPVHQAWALVSYTWPRLVICFTLDNIHVSMLFSWNIPPSPSPTESKSLFYTSVSLFLFCIYCLWMWTIFYRFYWICYNIAFVLCFGFSAERYVASYSGLNVHTLHWKWSHNHWTTRKSPLWLFGIGTPSQEWKNKQNLVKDEKILYHKGSSWVLHTLGTLNTWIIRKIQHISFSGSILQLRVGLFSPNF